MEPTESQPSGHTISHAQQILIHAAFLPVAASIIVACGGNSTEPGVKTYHATPTAPLSTPRITPTPTHPGIDCQTVFGSTDMPKAGLNISGADFGEVNDHGVLPGKNGQTYKYPSTANGYNGIETYTQAGIKFYRFPMMMERMMDKSGTLTSDGITGITQMLNDAANNGDCVILDLHNYGRYYDTPLTDSPADMELFSNFWAQIYEQFGSNPAFAGGELNNEVHDLPGGAAAWYKLAQAAVDKIRERDSTHYIIMTGYGWESAATWEDNNNGYSITDPVNKTIYAAHLYLDPQNNGANDECVPNIERQRVSQFFDFLKRNNKIGMITEFGGINSTICLQDIEDLSRLAQMNPLIRAIFLFAAGPWWGNDPLAVEHPGDTGIDRRVLAMVQNTKPTTDANNYPSRPADKNICQYANPLYKKAPDIQRSGRAYRH